MKSDLDLFIDPAKSFNSPFIIGPEEGRIVFGKYTPTLDTVALLTNAEDFNFDTFAKNILQTDDPLEKTVRYHEILGHVKLTKKSSYWANLFLINLYSSLGFQRVEWIVENGLVKEKKERIRRDLRDLINVNEFQRFLHNEWRIMQEAIANSYLLKAQNETDDVEFRRTIDLFVWKADSKNTSIVRLTKVCESIMKNLGYEKGWELLEMISLIASSPKLLSERKPKSQKELKRMKEEDFERGFQDGKFDPNKVNPTGRFIETVLVIVRNIDIVKKSLKRGVDPSAIASHAAMLCGHYFEILPNHLSLMDEHMKIISENKNVIPDDSRRSWHIEASKFLNFFKDITKIEGPISLFVNNIKTGKIYVVAHSLLNENRELQKYLYTEVMKYQFMKSLEKGEDLIRCFENRLHFCKDDCRTCGIYPYLRIARDTFRVASEFSYEDLREDAMDMKKWKERIVS